MFIDSTYFVGEINIPNVAANATSITQAIDQYEREILIQLLGYRLYSLLIADCTGEGGVPVTQIFIDLVNGAEFTNTYRGETIMKWEGLKNTQKQSLLAYYTFYKYVERDVTHLSGVGNVLVPSEKGNRASSVNKMINAWERMRELYGRVEPRYMNYYPQSVFNSAPSAYNFLFANRIDHPDWSFTPQWGINRFGI